MSAACRVRFAGAAVAKWAANLPAGVRVGGRELDAPGVILVHLDAPLERDVEGDATDVVTLADSASAEVIVNASALERQLARQATSSDAWPDSAAHVALLAIGAADFALGGLLQRVERLEVEVDSGR